jgi:serine/threonine-protein kinase
VPAEPPAVAAPVAPVEDAEATQVLEINPALLALAPIVPPPEGDPPKPPPIEDPEATQVLDVPPAIAQLRAHAAPASPAQRSAGPPTPTVPNAVAAHTPVRIPPQSTTVSPRGSVAPLSPPAAPTRAAAPAQPPAVGASSAPATPPRAAQKLSTLPGAKPDDKQFTQVGRYRILEHLGRGGMATVYKAHDPSIGRDVAIKFLHASLSEDAECRTRFLREARAAGGLSHPNIVVVHDVGEIEGRPYMAMEMLQGASLAEELEQNKRLMVRDVVSIGIQLARALDYAHSKGVIHRDIKPGNIMRERANGAVKVTDFGIAHVDESASVGEQRTRVGDVIGTPQYMSPEQTRGEKLDGRSDLFSAGIVLYQMLTGVRPFRGDSLVAIATKIASEDAPPIPKDRTDVPNSLRRVIDKCLAKQPAMRFQSGRELAEALAKVRTELDERARDATRPHIIPLRVKWAGTMALVVAVVMGLTAALITQRQYAAMMGQVSDYGASMARFIGAQNAASALGEDWDAVDVAVENVMKTGAFERVTVVDLTGTVRVASDAKLVGQPYRAPAGAAIGMLSGNVAMSRFEAGGESVLGFTAPITFQDKPVGQVALGIRERPLTQVANLSITLMIVLAAVTVVAVAVATYLLANWFAKPIQLVSEALSEIAKGRFGHRINEQRKDEFGQLFADFDAMAQALQDRASGSGDTPRPATAVTRAATPPPPKP